MSALDLCPLAKDGFLPTKNSCSVYKTLPRPWPTLLPTLWPTPKFVFLTIMKKKTTYLHKEQALTSRESSSDGHNVFQ